MQKCIWGPPDYQGVCAQTKIQVRASSCNFQVSSSKPRSRSGFQVAISKFQVSNQDPGQGFKLQFPRFKFQTKIQVQSVTLSIFLRFVLFLGATSKIVVLLACELNSTPCVLWGWLYVPRASCGGGCMYPVCLVGVAVRTPCVL